MFVIAFDSFCACRPLQVTSSLKHPRGCAWDKDGADPIYIYIYISLSLSLYIYMYIHIYIYVLYMHLLYSVCVYIYIYIYTRPLAASLSICQSAAEVHTQRCTWRSASEQSVSIWFFGSKRLANAHLCAHLCGSPNVRYMVHRGTFRSSYSFVNIAEWPQTVW